MHDCLIIGSGVAAVSAALTLNNHKKDILWVGFSSLSDKIRRAERISNYPGLPAVSGEQFAEALRRQIAEAGLTVTEGVVTAVQPYGGRFGAAVGREFYEAGTVILATGTGASRELPGEARLLGRGVSYCATCDGMLYRGKPVAVVGRSPDAPEEANFLKNLGCQVTYLAPKRPETLEADIPFVQTGTVSIQGQLTVTGLTANGETIPCAGVFILRPAVAPTDLLPTLATANGAIQVDRSMATNLPGVFAAGDCTGAPYQIAKAAGEGQVAALSACAYLDDPTHQTT